MENCAMTMETSCLNVMFSYATRGKERRDKERERISEKKWVKRVHDLELN